MKTHEAQALVQSAAIFLQRYKGANAALKEAKAALEEYMDGAQVDDLEGLTPGTGARLITRQGNRTLQLEQMSDELVLWCARNRVLTGAMGAADELPDEQRQALEPFVTRGAGTRYVDLYFPSWGQAAQEKKEAARAQSTAAPLPAPANVTPINAPEETFCQVHGAQNAKESKWGGLYCTGKDAGTKSGYCNWKSSAAA